ncbi:hypothetical protein FV139_14310 [Parahaliea maris]|uniref:Uncharacterized protein n=1 Tax=Parahaliea maris TaxID=2716870 RepID=A0A5C8ZTS8_9GAMM|nr:hypothetical protein [Parahaliea maris]TXS91903.1 hypothetical protein FV139_14310 [Parahaliea maris]
MQTGARALRQIITTALLVATAGLVSEHSSAETDAGDLELTAVKRSGFSMALPPWTVEIDDDMGASGRYVRTAHLKRAEVSWYLHPDTDLAPFDSTLNAMRDAYDMRIVERNAAPNSNPPRLEALLDYDGRAWFYITQLACPEVGVAVTISVMTPGADEAKALSQRMLSTFHCRSAELPRLVERWPDSDLPESFGLTLDGSPVLVHADGRWVMVARQSAHTVSGMITDPERAQRVLAGYGAALGDTWSVSGDGKEVRNLSGATMAWRLDSSLVGVVAANGFTCGEGESAFLILAGDDTGASKGADLANLAVRFGCPGATGGESVVERPSACEAGVEDFCDGQ